MFKAYKMNTTQLCEYDRDRGLHFLRKLSLALLSDQSTFTLTLIIKIVNTDQEEIVNG